MTFKAQMRQAGAHKFFTLLQHHLALTVCTHNFRTPVTLLELQNQDSNFSSVTTKKPGLGFVYAHEHLSNYPIADLPCVSPLEFTVTWALSAAQRA